MNSVPRKLTLGLILAVGAAACGDDVTVTEQTPVTPTPVVRSVVVSPASATIAPGGSFTFGAAVDADAGLARTVTWSSSNTNVAAVTAAGVATAAAGLTTGGVTSVCAVSTADADVKGCAQLTVNPAAAPTTVQIDAITVGCSTLNGALPGAAGCGLQVPVQVNNVGAQIDVAALVERAAGGGTQHVVFQVLDAAGTTVQRSYTQTLVADAIGSSDLAAQQQSQNRIVQSINTAEYDLGGTGGSARVFFLNGEHKIRACVSPTVDSCTGAGVTASPVRTVFFRNANGFHMAITNNISTGNNANGLAIRQVNAATGLAYSGGTALSLSAIPVSYTGQSVGGAVNTSLNFGSACDAFGARALTGAAVTVSAQGVLTGTLAYTAGSAAGAGNLNAYQISPVGPCAPVGEVPFATALDNTGNAFINFGLAGNFANNTLNNILNPVVPTLSTVTNVRLDNGGPAAIAGYTANPNGRVNGWYNGAVQLNVRNASNVDGVVAGALPADAGIGGAVTLQARAGVCTSVATCAALPLRTRVVADPAPTSAANLAETPLGSSDQMIVQSVDLFGNFTNPGATNAFGVDVTAPTHTIAQSWAAGVTQFNIQAGHPGNGLLPSTSTWTVTANDVAPALPAVASGVRSSVAAPAGTGSLLLDGLEMLLSTRSSTGSTFFCPVNAQFQATALACVTTVGGSGWTAAGSTVFGRAPGAAIAIDPAAANTPGYYVVTVNAIDQAGNRSTATSASIIFDNVLPVTAGLNTTPVPGVGGGTVTNNVSSTDNLDLAFAHFGFEYGNATQPLLKPANGGNALLYPMVTTGSGQQGVNPIGFNAAGPSILSFGFTGATTPFMRTVQQVTGGNVIAAPAAMADISGNAIRSVTSDVAGNFVAAPIAIASTTNAPVALPSPWTTLAGVPPGGLGFNGTYIGTQSIAAVFIAGGTAATRTVTFTATATSASTPGWQAPFTGGGLDFWVLDLAPGRTGYIRACTAGTPTYNIGTNSWIYSCAWTPGSSVANGYLLPATGATQWIAIGRNATGDGLATLPVVLTINP